MWPSSALPALYPVSNARFPANRTASLLSIWWLLLLLSHRFGCCKQPFSFYVQLPKNQLCQAYPEIPCVVSQFTPDAECFFLDFGLGRSVEFEGSGLILSTGMCPLYPGVCFGVVALAAYAARVNIKGAESACVNTLRSTDHNPLFLNPFIAVSMVAALGNAMPTRDAICSVDAARISPSASLRSLMTCIQWLEKRDI
jgi:hypothetical protein